MNSKVIAAGVVVALCAVALIGVGYAYTATMTNDNSISTEYVVLDTKGSGKAEAFFNSSTSKVQFDTATTSGGTQWTFKGPVTNQSSSNLKVSGSGLSVDNISVDLEITVEGNPFTDEVLKTATITFTEVKPSGASAEWVGSSVIYTFKEKDGTKSTPATETDPAINVYSWNKTGTFNIGSEYEISMNVSQFTTTVAGSDIAFKMVLEYKTS